MPSHLKGFHPNPWPPSVRAQLLTKGSEAVCCYSPEADKQALQGHNAKTHKRSCWDAKKKKMLITLEDTQPPGLSHAQWTELQDANTRKNSFHTDTLYPTSEAVVATSAEACFAEITATALYLAKFFVAFNKRWNKSLLFCRADKCPLLVAKRQASRILLCFLC